MFHPGASFEEAIHPPGTLAGIFELPKQTGQYPADARVTLNRKRSAAVQVASTVLVPTVRTKDPFVAEEAQLGPTVFFLQVLLVARVDMSPLWAGRPARMNNKIPSQPAFSWSDGRVMESVNLHIELSIRNRRVAMGLVRLQAWATGDFSLLLAQADHIVKDPPAFGASKGSDKGKCWTPNDGVRPSDGSRGQIVTGDSPSYKSLLLQSTQVYAANSF